MCKISFISGPSFSFGKEKIIHVLKKYAKKEGFSISEIQYNFIDKSSMFKINKSYLKHENDTDVITFDYSKEKKINAEVYISLEMMNENAKTLRQDPENEAVRLISHALFHCMGYSDKSSSERSKMRKMENSFINDVSRETIDNV